MLRMDQVCVIRHKVLVEKLTQREVARQLGISRNTVSKYLSQSEPAYQQKNARTKPVQEKVRVESMNCWKSGEGGQPAFMRSKPVRNRKRVRALRPLVV